MLHARNGQGSLLPTKTSHPTSTWLSFPLTGALAPSCRCLTTLPISSAQNQLCRQTPLNYLLSLLLVSLREANFYVTLHRSFLGQLVFRAFSILCLLLFHSRLQSGSEVAESNPHKYKTLVRFPSLPPTNIILMYVLTQKACFHHLTDVLKELIKKNTFESRRCWVILYWTEKVFFF